MRELRSCLWELTLRCNLQCLHCGSSAGRRRSSELTMDECPDVAAQLLDLGCRDVTLIGGEVFLYRGWHQLARLFSDGGAKVNVMSNGLGYSARSLHEIEHARLTNVGISIDGLEASHNRIRNHPRSFQEACRALRLLSGAGVPTGVVTCLVASNLADLDGLYDVLVEHGVGVWQLQLANSMGRLLDSGERLVPPSRIEDITKFIRHKRALHEIFVYASDSIGYYGSDEAHIRGRSQPICIWEGCQAGLTSIFIDSVGNVKGCGSMYDRRFVEGSVRSEPLAAIWGDEGRFSYNRAFRPDLLTGACRRCERGALCRGGCRSSNHFNNRGRLYESVTCTRAQRVEPAPALS